MKLIRTLLSVYALMQLVYFALPYITDTRMMMAFLVLQPAHYQTTMALIIVSACPLIAHFFALSGSIVTNLFFVLSLLLTAAMAVLNLWMTSFSIS